MIVVLLVLRPILFSLEKIALQFTKKTKTKLDDIFIAKIYKPVAFILVMIGVRISIEQLTLTFIAQKIISTIIFSLIGIALAYIVYYFVDIILFAAIRYAAQKDESNTRKSLIPLFGGILKVILSCIVILYVMSLWGVQIGPFLAGLGIAGLAVALAATNTCKYILWRCDDFR